MADKGAVPATPIPGADAPAEPAKPAKAKAAKASPAAEPVTPVDVISSVPLNVQIAPESLASLGAPPAGTAEPVAAPAVAPTATLITPIVPPVSVTVIAPVPPVTVVKGEGATLAPTTTEQEDVVTAGQRRINMVWELTQSIIAIVITFAIVYLAIVQTPAETITNAFFLIVGFYYSRTNHQAIGGEGSKPNPTKYEGR